MQSFGHAFHFKLSNPCKQDKNSSFTSILVIDSVLDHFKKMAAKKAWKKRRKFLKKKKSKSFSEINWINSSYWSNLHCSLAIFHWKHTKNNKSHHYKMSDEQYLFPIRTIADIDAFGTEIPAIGSPLNYQISLIFLIITENLISLPSKRHGWIWPGSSNPLSYSHLTILKTPKLRSNI